MVDPKDIMNKVLDQANERCNQWNPPAQASERDDERDALEYARDQCKNIKIENDRRILELYLTQAHRAGRAGMVPASEVEKVKQSEFDRGWKAAIEFANAAWKPILNPKESDGGADGSD